jgi:hypothetical protein
MAKKTVKFNQAAVETLPNNKPVVYKIGNASTPDLYIGIAKRGRVQDRLKEHLPSGSDPIPGGSKVQIEQMTSIGDAAKKEKELIERHKPTHNKLGK